MYPTHNHSEFSALDGYGTADEIAIRVQSLGLNGAWLTDHGTVAGLLPFRKAMEARGLFGGFGMEAYQSRYTRGMKKHPDGQPIKKGQDAFHLILLAHTFEGYMNLLRIADEANRTGFHYDPRVDWDLLEKYNEGIIATSACLGGLVAQGIQDDDLTSFHRYRNIFGDRFMVEIHTYESPLQRDINKALMGLCVDHGVYPIVANDAHYPTIEEYDAHELLIAVNQGRKFDPNNWNNRLHPPCLYIMSEDDVKKHLDYLDPDFVQMAIDNTDVVAESSQFNLPEIVSHLPKFPRSKQPKLELTEKLEVWCADKSDEYIDRALFELKALTDADLQDYFLIVEDFCNYAREHDIMIGPGRGSAGGSVVAYALGITSVDPIKYGLYFERFWNPGRTKGLPDIDVDFEQSRRPDVKDYLADLYGPDRVRGIGNHIRFRPKSALDRTAMAMGTEYITYQDAKKISKIIDKTTDAGHLADWDEIMDLVGDEIMPWVEKYPDLFHYAESITNRLSTYGVHASAVVVSDVDLPGHLPLMRRTDKNKNEVFVTAHDMYSVEDQGFPKFDLLGLTTLDVLKTTITLAGEPEFDFNAIDYDTLPEECWQIIDQGRTLGLFQIEQAHAARMIAKQLRPRSILDMAAIVALNRPGPLRSGATERFLARRNGEMDLEYIHPFMEPILSETWGEFVYQESVIRLCVELGYTLSDADQVRKILGKKKLEDMIAEEPRFMAAATAVMGERIAASIWDLIKDFSKYSFNKSHAVAYGLICAWTMYAKWRWPQEFIMASIITSSDKRGDFIAEARRMGIEVNHPNVNISDLQISRVGDDIYLGLTEVKYVGTEAAQWIIDNRPEHGYHSYEDLLEIREARQKEWKEADQYTKGRSPGQKCGKRAIESLLNAGAFDTITEREIELAQRIEFEDELLGVVLTDIYTPIIQAHAFELENVLSYSDLEEYGAGSIPGIITAIKPMKVGPGKKNAGREMAHITVEWESEQLRLTVFPDDWERLTEEGHQHLLHQVGIFRVNQNSRGTSIRKMSLLNGQA